MTSHPLTQRDDSFVLAVRQAFKLVLTENFVVLPPGARILQAFSGGPDSTALLAALLIFAVENNLELHVCHLNHGLRGAESDADEEFCRKICKLWGVPLHVERAAGSGSSEAELREIRYECLERVAAKIDARLCVTGHTLDDQIETMLFRLCRGTGLSGLVGIPAFRKVSPLLTLIRPMLSTYKSDCLRFLNRLGICARFDSSNNDDTYSRNFIRNQIVPLLEDRFPGFRQHMEQLRTVVSADESLLSCLTSDALLEMADHSSDKNIWLLDEFNELPLSLRRRVLCQAFHERDIDCEFARIEALLEAIDADGDAAVSLNEEWEMRLKQGELHWKSRLDKSLDYYADIGQLSFPLQPEGLTLIQKLGLAINVEKVNFQLDRSSLPGSQEHELLGDLTGAGQLKLRLRMEGDQIQPLGMECMVRLKKFLHTHKSSKTLSFGGRVLVLANESEVLWVPGCGMSQRIAVANRATHRIQVVRMNSDETSLT